MYNNTHGCMIIHINGHLLYSALDLVKFTGFQETKTNVNKRLLHSYVQCPTEHLRRKGSDYLANMQEVW